MATGIVSIGLRLNGLSIVSDILFAIGVVGYGGLVVASGWRLADWPRRYLADLVGPRGFALLTFVAASNVLAARLVLGGRLWAAAVLLAIGAAGWLLLCYAVPLGLMIGSGAHAAPNQVGGTWFMWVVGTQSITVAAAALAAPGPVAALAAAGSVCWGIGVVLYLVLATLGMARLLVQPVGAADLAPAYWIFLGAAAISVLAGAELLELPAAVRLLPEDAVAGVLVVLWSFCTWLIPLLLAVGVWRHLVRRVPLRYESGLWSMVFPIGMYGVASYRLGEATDVHWLVAIGGGEVWIAFAVWVAVFAAMLSTGMAALRRSIGKRS